MQQRPNLLYIHSDQHNPYVMGCAGDPVVETPHLDRLAAEGVQCTQVYCPSPVCVASRMAMLAGRYPSDIEVWTNSQILDSGVPTMAHAMGAAGYRPVLIGRMHSIGPDQLHGYAERPVGDHSSNWPGGGRAPAMSRNSLEQAGPGQSSYQVHDEDVTAAAVYFLNQLGVQKRAGQSEGPFSLSIGFMLPHSPYLARRPLYDYYRERIRPPAVREPFGDHLHPAIHWWRAHGGLQEIPEEWVLNARAAYWALVAAMDGMIGRILTALRENDLADNTLVVYSSDHGELVGEHDLWMKRTFYEESAKVPAIVSWPGVLPAGTQCDRVMSALDLNATMLQALDAPPLPNSPGRSALELLRHGTERLGGCSLFGIRPARGPSAAHGAARAVEAGLPLAGAPPVVQSRRRFPRASGSGRRPRMPRVGSRVDRLGLRRVGPSPCRGAARGAAGGYRLNSQLGRTDQRTRPVSAGISGRT